ncbi:hypothetical protein [Nocardia sp. NPDC052112]|uniref:hypothetical protein n=1 Tax=Nocardia sp. NPDC052112 TaxID=3155646 RepID=UPI0034228033
MSHAHRFMASAIAAGAIISIIGNSAAYAAPERQPSPLPTANADASLDAVSADSPTPISPDTALANWIHVVSQSAVAAPLTMVHVDAPADSSALQPVSAEPVPVAAKSDETDPQADINNALSQAGNEFMLAATVGSMAGGVIGLVGGCVIGAVVGAIGGCIPGMGLGGGIGTIIGGVVVGLPAGIAALAQAYNTLHAAGEISSPVPLPN